MCIRDSRTAVKIRAEDGRSIRNTDISMFINNLPNGKDTVHFTTEDASGSTSQAAGVVEAMEAGTSLLLMDEDTSATNFMIRDELMQRVIHRDMEPITPFLDRIRELYGICLLYTSFYCILGVVAGMVIGTLPGLSATMGIAILTPLTFWLEPAQGMAVLLGIYNSAIWAGGISAILINTPGTPASIAQTFDGYYMVTQGKVKKALNMNTIYSVIGGLIGTVVLIVFSFPVAEFALKFGPPEMFAMALFGLSMMIGVSGGSVFKGLLAGALGLLVSTIGMRCV